MSVEHLTRIEELLLLSVWKLKDSAHGLAVRSAMTRLLGREVSVGAVYIPLERLASRGLLETSESEPESRPGGRRKRFYRVTADGVAALNTVRKLQSRAWLALPISVGGLRLESY